MVRIHASIQLIIFTLLLLACKNNNGDREVTVASFEVAKKVENDIIPGAERLALYYPKLKNKRVACVVNHTSMIKENHLIDSLLNMKVNVVKVFAPEHGFRGKQSDGEKVENGIDEKSGLPIISLYGKNKKPSPEDLDGVDVLLFDIQDVGVRFYTYLSTMHYIMEAGAESNIPVIVLDRPNPHADYIDGPLLKKEFRSFVGLHPVPVVYGMTIGEYAKMINGEGWLKNGIKSKLTVIPISNYHREDYYSLPVNPSPNLPNMRSILLYPSICFFEGTTISVGRGTNKQFQVLGNPQMTGEPYSFTPNPNEGSKYPPHQDKKCYGVDLSSLTLGSLKDLNKLDLQWVLKFFSKCQEKNIPFFLETNHFNRLAGTDQLKKQILAGKSEIEIRESWEEDLIAFASIRNKYLIYPSQDTF